MHWNAILSRHEKAIRKAFEFRMKYLKDANRKLDHIKQVVLRSLMKRDTGLEKNKKKKVKKKHPKLIFVGIHVR